MYYFLVLLRQNLDSPLEGNTIIHTKMEFTLYIASSWAYITTAHKQKA